MNSIKTGDMVDVSFDVESREYNGRWYTDVKAWKLSKKGGSVPDNNGGNYVPVANDMPPASDDDLPF